MRRVLAQHRPAAANSSRVIDMNGRCDGRPTVPTRLLPRKDHSQGRTSLAVIRALHLDSRSSTENLLSPVQVFCPTLLLNGYTTTLGGITTFPRCHVEAIRRRLPTVRG